MAKKSHKVAPSSPESPVETPFALVDFRMLTCSARQPLEGIKKNLPEVNQLVGVQVGRTASEPNGIAIILKFAIEEQKNTDTGFSIEASFGIKFGRSDRPFTEEEAIKIGRRVAVHVAWPFWRDFVFSTTGRMNLPPLTIPIINPAYLQFGDDTKTEPEKVLKSKRVTKRKRSITSKE